nr:uncharacterized mitochondrial protein AtMg00810-like [Tanacetum cinerariifolium]
MLVHQGEGLGTQSEPHHTPFPEVETSHPTTSSILLPSIPTAPISPVTQPVTTPIIQYSRRARIAQSFALPIVADEPASPVRDAQEEEIVKLKDRVKVLEDKEGIAAKQSGDDAPIKGRSINEGEAAAERISNDSEEIARVLTSMDATTRRPMTKKQKREYYMAVIKSNLGWRFKDFKGMTFEEIEAKFAKVWKQDEDFIPMGSKEETKRLNRKGLNLEKEQVKKQKSSEEVPEIETSTEEFTKEKMKEMMQLVPVEDVYVQALQVKHPIIDWKYKFPLRVKVVATARRLEMPLPEVCTAIEEKKKKLPRKGFKLEQEKANKQKTSEEVPDKEKSPEEIPEEKGLCWGRVAGIVGRWESSGKTGDLNSNLNVGDRGDSLGNLQLWSLSNLLFIVQHLGLLWWVSVESGLQESWGVGVEWWSGRRVGERGFEDPDHPDKVYKVVKALYGLHQAPRACPDKYVAEILRKFGLTDTKSASTPIDTEKPLLKDLDGEDVDVHIYRSMIGSLMYLTSSRPDIMFVVCACTHFQVTPKASHLHAVKRIFGYLKGKPHLGLWYPKDSPFDLMAYSDSDYAGASLDRKSTTEGCQFFGCRLISWQYKKQTVVATSSTEAEYVDATINAIASVLPTEEPKYSLSMEDEHLSTILETESDEVIKSSVENLVSILSEFKVTSDNERVLWELAHIDPIPPGIEEADFDLEEEICLVENLFYDNSSPRLLEKLNVKIFDTILESLSPSHIPVEDSDSQMEEIDLFLATDDLMPLGIENDDYDSERDIHFLEELLSDYPFPFPKNKSSNFDHHDDPSFPRPPLEPPDVENSFDFELDTGVLTTKVVEDISEHYVLMPKFLPSQPALCLNIDPLLPFSSENEDKVFKPGILSYLLISHRDKITSDFSENPMMILVRNVDSPSKFYMYLYFLQLMIRKQVGDLSTHTIMYTSPALTQKVFTNIRRVGKGFCGVETPLFEGMLVAQEVGEGDVSAAHDEIPTTDEEPSIPSPTPPTSPLQPSQDIPSTYQAQPTPPQLPQEDKSEPAKVQEVVDIVTTAKIITEVHTAASETITTASITITAAEARVPIATLTTSPSRARKNMMIYLKNVAGFKMDYFKGMSYDDIRPIFERYFDSNVAFLQKTKEWIEEDESRALKRINDTPTEKAAKRQKLDEEVEELKRHLQIVPNEDDDNNKPYYKIIRADGTHQLYISFLTLLRNFDREELEALWVLVKERFATTKPKNFSDGFLLITLRAMFEKPDIHAQIWKNQRSVHCPAKVKGWKLLESCGMQIIIFTTTQLILVVERKYPLIRFTLDQMLNVVRLKVEEESEASLELLRFIRQQHQERAQLE